MLQVNMIFYYHRFISLNSINSNTKRAKKKEKTIEPKLNSTESVIQCVCHARNDNGKLWCMFGINLKWENKQETTNNVTKRKCSVCTSNILRVLQKLPSSKPKAKKQQHRRQFSVWVRIKSTRIDFEPAEIRVLADASEKIHFDLNKLSSRSPVAHRVFCAVCLSVSPISGWFVQTKTVHW